MKEKGHLESVRNKILYSAQELFIKQGYKNTTIRQVVKKSGILTGSIYHLFRNKEDIFQALVLRLLHECIDIINARFAGATPAFKYAAMCFVELKAVEVNLRVRETYYEGYTSKAIFSKMVEHVAAVSQQLFADSKLSLTQEEYYIRTLLIKGAMRSCVAQFYFFHEINVRSCWHDFLFMILPVWGVEAEEIRKVESDIEADRQKLLVIVDSFIDVSGTVE